MLAFLLVAAASAQSDTVTRGGTFTVTVLGTPRTPYDVWPEGTSDMTGEPGDQPPVIVAGQVDVAQDPAGGPYPIGSHPISGGGTIRGDVPPDSSTTPATSYYAEVTTDASGYGVVMFRTSSATATDRQFHITAQNPADPGKDVPIFLGGIPTTPPVPVMPLPLPATLMTPIIPVATTPVPLTTVPATPVTTMTPPAVTPPVETPSENMPVKGIPLSPAGCLAAIGLGVLLRGGDLRQEKVSIMGESGRSRTGCPPP